MGLRCLKPIIYMVGTAELVIRKIRLVAKHLPASRRKPRPIGRGFDF